jgi:hypothetical protein
MAMGRDIYAVFDDMHKDPYDFVKINANEILFFVAFVNNLDPIDPVVRLMQQRVKNKKITYSNYEVKDIVRQIGLDAASGTTQDLSAIKYDKQWKEALRVLNILNPG